MKISDDERSGRVSILINLATFVLAVMVLRAGQAVLVPIAIASLIAFLLWPLVNRLRHWGLGKTPAVVAATCLAFIVITLVGWVMTVQAWDIVRDLPRYEKNLDAKASKLEAPHASGALSPVMAMMGRYEKKLMAPAESLDGDGHPPVPVRMEPAPKSTLAAAGDIAVVVLGPLGRTLMVIIFVIAILMQRDDLEDRFLQLLAPDRIPVIRTVIADASGRIYRYLSMQLAVNTCYGIFVALGLWLIGIPNVLLWGLLSMLLRFIPYLGPWVAAAFPIAMAVAIEPGWMKLVYTLGLYMLAELVTANLVEVLLYGAAAGISGLALMFAAVFWTWLWGAPGLLLSTPLTVCLMVMGHYLPAFKIFGPLLGRDPHHHPRPGMKTLRSRLRPS